MGSKPHGGIILFLLKGEAVESSYVIEDISSHASSSAFHRLMEENSLKSMLARVIELLGKVIEIGDAYTCGHQKKVAKLSEVIAKKLKLKDKEVKK